MMIETSDGDTAIREATDAANALVIAGYHEALCRHQALGLISALARIRLIGGTAFVLEGRGPKAAAIAALLGARDTKPGCVFAVDVDGPMLAIVEAMVWWGREIDARHGMFVILDGEEPIRGV